MTFDLHFTGTRIKPLTQKGAAFILSRIGIPDATPNNYQLAVEAGLRISFEDAAVRDWVTGETIRIFAADAVGVAEAA